MGTLRMLLATVLYKRARTVFTVGSVVVAFLLFGLLMPLNRVFSSQVQFADANRLIVVNKTSFMRPLPVSYGERLAKVDGVDAVGHFTYFGAFYRDQSTPIAAIATDPARFEAMVEEVRFADPQARERWLANPAGIAIGRQLAQEFGWKEGDLVPLFSSIYQRQDGSPVWTFEVEAIFDSPGEDGNTKSLVIHYDYFDQARVLGKGTVGWYALRIHDPAQAGRIAEAIDASLVNSTEPTSTSTEKAFAQSFLRQVGDFGAMITTALALVFYTLVLVTANTMAQSVRERFPEIAVLKTLGYSDRRVFGLVLGESLLILLGGGCLGLLLAAIAIHEVVVRAQNQLLSTLHLGLSDCAWALALMLGVSVVVALVPAWRAARQNIVMALGEAV
jgi:putative ABC transport system permease protein